MRSQDAEVDVPPVVPAGARREIRPRDRRGDAAEIHAVFTHSSPRAPPDAGAHAEDGGSQPQVRRRAGGERLQNRVPSRVLAVNRSADGPTEQLALASVDVAVNATPLTARNSHSCPPPTAAAAPSPSTGVCQRRAHLRAQPGGQWPGRAAGVPVGQRALGAGARVDRRGGQRHSGGGGEQPA